MAKASEQFEQSDLTRWGMVAVACWAIAVFGANVSALLPDRVLTGLHSSKLQGANMELVRLELSNLAQKVVQLRQENAELQSRFVIAEQARNVVTQRVGALEVSIPNLLEAMPAGADIDLNALTASVGGKDKAEPVKPHVPLTVRHIPLEQVDIAVVEADQPMPALPTEVKSAAQDAVSSAEVPLD